MVFAKPIEAHRHRALSSSNLPLPQLSLRAVHTDVPRSIRLDWFIVAGTRDSVVVRLVSPRLSEADAFNCVEHCGDARVGTPEIAVAMQLERLRTVPRAAV